MKIIILLLSFTSLIFANINMRITKNSNISSLTKKEISDVYLGKRTTVQGVKIIPLDDDKYYTEFYQTIVGKSPKQLRAYWIREMGKSKRKPPKKFTLSQIEGMIQKNYIFISYSLPILKNSKKLEVK
jgi:hypothetical protein